MVSILTAQRTKDKYGKKYLLHKGQLMNIVRNTALHRTKVEYDKQAILREAIKIK